jgi:hypothetical protein
VVKKPRKQASAPALKQRIADRASSDPENLRLAQARDLAALHRLDRADFSHRKPYGDLQPCRGDPDAGLASRGESGPPFGVPSTLGLTNRRLRAEALDGAAHERANAGRVNQYRRFAFAQNSRAPG